VELTPSDRAPGLVLGEGASIADDVELGAHVVVHAGVTVEPGCTIQDHAVLGKPTVLWERSRTRRTPPGGTRLAEGVRICAGAIVLAGSSIGPRTIIGDKDFIRERAEIGPDCVFGSGVLIGADAKVGARVRMQTYANVVSGSVVEDDVFLGPVVTTTNDNALGRRRGPASELRPVTLRRGCRIGGSATLLPGVEVGEEAVVASGAVVTRDVAPRTIMMGVPARPVGEVPAEDLLDPE
jgi:acetyltransferase-like isoleucine patch superfamily enzyme